jgi:hypothetical protein
MSIPESQLDTWSRQGSTTQSAATYQTIRNVLNDSIAPYYTKNFSIFLQGSYGNDTNVVDKEADVDVVMRLNDTYYYDTSRLSPAAKASFDTAFSAATYGFDEFRADVHGWLKKKFGDDVVDGKKAIAIKGAGGRRNADVLACTKFRRYTKESNGNDDQYHEGICFFRTDTHQRIENFPKQHGDNITAKHQATKGWFKPVSRMYKNMRNRMVEDGLLADGRAPSYFIEGALWNVPDQHYGSSYAETFVETYNWIAAQDKSKLVCANGLHWLVLDNQPTSCPVADFDEFMAATKKFWQEWN